MPRKSKGPHLAHREGKWVIRDGQGYKRTKYGIEQREEAERELGEWIAAKYRPDTRSTKPSDIFLADVMNLYVEHKLPTISRPAELLQKAERIIEYCGHKTVADINGAFCRNFTKHFRTDSVARHHMEDLRSATNHYDREYGLDHSPKFTLPQKGKPREGALTRSQAAKLLWAARNAGNRHLVRYILIGLYTGTRSTAICQMQWMPNVDGGWFDLERGVMHRAPEGEANASKKRRPSSRIPDRLLAHLKRWKRLDTADNATIRHVVHWKGSKVLAVKKSFKSAVRAAELPKDTIPHCLRHTAITWAMQSGLRPNTVCEFFGVTTKVMEDVYWKHSPDYQDEMKGLGTRKR